MSQNLRAKNEKIWNQPFAMTSYKQKHEVDKEAYSKAFESSKQQTALYHKFFLNYVLLRVQRAIKPRVLNGCEAQVFEQEDIALKKNTPKILYW